MGRKKHRCVGAGKVGKNADPKQEEPVASTSRHTDEQHASQPTPVTSCSAGIQTEATESSCIETQTDVAHKKSIEFLMLSQKERDDRSESQPTPVSSSSTGVQTETTKSCIATQTYVSHKKFLEFQKDLTMNQNLRDELEVLKSRMVKYSDISQEKLKSSDKHVEFFTGIPKYDLLMVIFKYLSKVLPDKSSHSLSRFQEFLLVMIHLKLNVSLLNLSKKFEISEHVANEIFKTWINVMYVRFKPTIEWPERKILINAMSSPFKKVFNGAVTIVDCIEICIDKPSNFQARVLTWSDYKNRYTVKFVIGVTTNGAIKFVSNGYVGKVMDRQVLVDSGFLDHIVPGDTILAKFDQSELSAFAQNGEKIDVELAKVRPHAEKIIGHIRNKYSILSGVLQNDLLVSANGGDIPLIDKIFVVVCALINFCPSVMEN